MIERNVHDGRIDDLDEGGKHNRERNEPFVHELINLTELI
jgi:hypothetical protein